MLALRIIGTVIMAYSVISAFCKNAKLFQIGEHEWNYSGFFSFTIWGWLWRAFIIVALWVIH